MVPLLAYWHDLRPKTILVQEPLLGAGQFVLPANPRVQRLSILDPHEPVPRTLRPPSGWREADGNRSWIAYAPTLCHFVSR
jgi:hypothetical protein